MDEFEKELVTLFNDAVLPFDAKRYVVLTFARNVEDAYRAWLEKKAKNQEEGKTETIT